jgi:predicted nucleotidyltransferase
LRELAADVHFGMTQPLHQIDASSLRRELFHVLRALDTDGPIEILRNGHVVAVLSIPPPPTGPTPKPRVDPRRLARICKKHHIKRLSLFGSVVRDDFGPTSDVDVLYEPEAGHLDTLKSFVEANNALADLFGRRVDFIDRSLIENSKNQHRRRAIFEDERVVYENGRVRLAGVLS